MIRSGKINDEEQIVGGPALLAQRVMQFLCKDNGLNAISEKEQSIIMGYEKEHEVVKRRNSIAEDYNYLINSNRIELGKSESNKYVDCPIRALTDLRISKQKEKDVFLYLKENFKDSKDKVKELKLKELLGYSSQSILDKLKYRN